MNFEELISESIDFHRDTIKPIFDYFEGLSEEDANTLRKIIAFDLLKVGIMCAEVDNNVDIMETNAIKLFFLTAFPNYVFAPGSDTANLFDNWQYLNQEQKNNFIKLIKNMLADIDFKDLINTAREKNNGEFSTPKLLNTIDTDNGTIFAISFFTGVYKFANIVIKADGMVTLEEEAFLLKICSALLMSETNETDNSDSKENKVNKTEKEEIKLCSQENFDDVIRELNELIGMDNIKQEVNTLINFLKVQKERLNRGMLKTPLSLHAVFAGPPGTGKTTMARLLGKIYKHLGFLSKGHLVETDRAGLVAGYVGQTSLKVDEIVNNALDGILFIDEAYALKPEAGSNDYGQEAIDILLKRIEDYRDRLVVIVAGYTEEMDRFLGANPGVSSRFNRYFYFDHYGPNELVLIFEKFCKSGHYKLTSSAKEKLNNTFEILHVSRDRTFGNGRLARNIFEKVIEKQANRIAGIAQISDEILMTITEEDIPPVNNNKVNNQNKSSGHFLEAPVF